MSATNVARAGKRGNICVGNNVSSFARALFYSEVVVIIRDWLCARPELAMNL